MVTSYFLTAEGLTTKEAENCSCFGKAFSSVTFIFMEVHSQKCSNTLETDEFCTNGCKDAKIKNIFWYLKVLFSGLAFWCILISIPTVSVLLPLEWDCSTGYFICLDDYDDHDDSAKENTIEIVTCRLIGLVWLMPTLWKMSPDKAVWLCPIWLLGIIPGQCYPPDCGQEVSVRVFSCHVQNHGKVWDTCQVSRQERFRTKLGLKFSMSLDYLYWSSQKNYLRKHFKVVYPSGVGAYLLNSNTKFWSSECYLKCTLPKNAWEQSGTWHRAGLILTGSRTWWLCFFGNKMRFCWL